MDKNLLKTVLITLKLRKHINRFYLAFPLVLFTLTLVSWTSLKAQTLGRSLEEIKQELAASNTDSARYANLSALSSAYLGFDPDSALIIAQEALLGATQQKLKTVEVNALISLGEAHDVRGNYTDAISALNQALELSLALKDTKLITRAYNCIGLAHQFKGFYEEARENYEQALIYEQKEPDLVLRSKIFHNLGIAFERTNDYYNAFKNYFKARNLKDSLIGAQVKGIKADALFSTYMNLGSLYQDVLQFDEARSNYTQALALAENIPGKKYQILYNIGTVEELDSNFIKAEEYYLKSLEITKKNNFTAYQPYILDALGNAKRGQGALENAQILYDQAYLVLEKYPNPIILAAVLNDEGFLFLELNQYQEALNNALEGLEIAKAIQDEELLMYAHKLCAQTYEKLADPINAHTHLRNYTDLYEKHQRDESKKGLIGLRAVMDRDFAKEQQKRLLQEQAISYEQEKNRILQITLFAIIALALALAWALWKVSKTNVALKDLNQQLSNNNVELATNKQKLELANNKLQQFAFATGHDLKESLRNITSFNQLAAIEMAEDTIMAQQHLKEAAMGSKRMRKMLDDLLHYSNIGGDNSVMDNVPLDEVLAAVKQQLKEDILSSKGDVHLLAHSVLKADRIEMEQLFFNLVHNALRYTAKGVAPRVKIKIENIDNQAVFIVADNGLGIAAKERENIFKPFHRLHDRTQSGSGLGLSICKRIIASYDGKIWHEAMPDGGSKFCFTLPKAKPQLVMKK